MKRTLTFLQYLLPTVLLILTTCGSSSTGTTNATNSAPITQGTPVYSAAYDRIPTKIPANHPPCPAQTGKPLSHHVGFVEDLNGDAGQIQFPVLHGGVTKVKAWLVCNNGTQVWPVYAEFLPLWAPQNPTVPATPIVFGASNIPKLSPGQFGVVTLSFTTPQTTGEYTQVVIMATSEGDAAADGLSIGFSVA